VIAPFSLDESLDFQKARADRFAFFCKLAKTAALAYFCARLRVLRRKSATNANRRNVTSHIKKLIMKISWCLLFLISFLSVTGQKVVTYVDGEDRIVSEQEFQKLKKVFVAKNDSLNIYKAVIYVGESGKLESTDEIYSELGKITKLDSSKPIVIVFHPGNDPCHSSGTKNKVWIKDWFKDFESQVYKTVNVKPIYLYKKDEGLERYAGIINWHKDPKGLIENTFFNYHYPCGSYVIISPSGRYTSGFGEFPVDRVVRELKQIIQE
jgi:hypothetical protein